MTNYKKLKNGFSIAELLIALSIFALISTLGIEGFSFMLKNQLKHREAIEKELIKEVKIYNCKKELYYQHLLKQDALLCTHLQEECKPTLGLSC